MPSNKDLQEIVAASLYEKLNLSDSHISTLRTLIDYNPTAAALSVDVFCPGCNAVSVFIPSDEGQIGSVPISSSHFKEFVYGNNPIANLHFRCSRNRKHYLGLTLICQDDNIIKTGQYPSHADINFPSLNKYTKILPSEQLADLKRASGLVSHGVGAGSLIYLRRVFEYLLLKAKAEAVVSGEFEEEAFARSRVIDKIVLLKDYLPSAMFQNKEAYSILSKGIHELAEDECLEYFGMLFSTIELILDEILEKENKKKKVEEIRKGISAIHSRMKASPGEASP